MNLFGSTITRLNTASGWINLSFSEQRFCVQFLDGAKTHGAFNKRIFVAILSFDFRTRFIVLAAHYLGISRYSSPIMSCKVISKSPL